MHTDAKDLMDLITLCASCTSRTSARAAGTASAAGGRPGGGEAARVSVPAEKAAIDTQPKHLAGTPPLTIVDPATQPANIVL